MHPENGNVVTYPKVIVGLKLICSCFGFTNTSLRVQAEILVGRGYRLYSSIKSFYQSKRCGLKDVFSCIFIRETTRRLCCAWSPADIWWGRFYSEKHRPGSPVVLPNERNYEDGSLNLDKIGVVEVLAEVGQLSPVLTRWVVKDTALHLASLQRCIVHNVTMGMATASFRLVDHFQSFGRNTYIFVSLWLWYQLSTTCLVLIWRDCDTTLSLKAEDI